MDSEQILNLVRQGSAGMRALADLIPEVAAMRGQLQNRYHLEGDVFTHTGMVLDHLGPSEDPRVLLAGLLHDVGKRNTACPRPDGAGFTFYDHEKVGADMVGPILGRFDFLCEVMVDVRWLVLNHMRINRIHEMRPGKAASLRAHPLFPLLVRLNAADHAGRIRGERSA